MLVIYKKELQSYFNGMMGYVFIAFALALIGVYLTAVNLTQGYPNFEYVLDSVRFLFILIMPILTMRSLSEERRQRTDQLLYSSPISTWSVVLGKFFASLTVFAIPLLISCAYPLLLKQFGLVNLKTAYAGIVGFLLMGGAAIAIGVFLSSLCESQMVAAVASYAVLLVCYLMPNLSNMVSASAMTSAIGFSLLSVGANSFAGGVGSPEFGSARNWILGTITLLSAHHIGTTSHSGKARLVNLTRTEQHETDAEPP